MESGVGILANAATNGYQQGKGKGKNKENARPNGQHGPSASVAPAGKDNLQSGAKSNANDQTASASGGGSKGGSKGRGGKGRKRG